MREAAPKSQNSLFFSLLAGNCDAETGSIATASATTSAKHHCFHYFFSLSARTGAAGAGIDVRCSFPSLCIASMASRLRSAERGTATPSCPRSNRKLPRVGNRGASVCGACSRDLANPMGRSRYARGFTGILEQVAEGFLGQRLAVLAGDVGQIAARASPQSLGKHRKDRERDVDGVAALFRFDLSDTIPHMLAAEPHRVATAQAGVQQNV